MFVIKGQYPPIVLISPTSGKRFAISGSEWIEIGPEITKEEVHNGWINPRKIEIVASNTRNFSILSSKGDKKYNVTVINGIATCECPASGWGRKCHHLDKALEKMKQENLIPNGK